MWCDINILSLYYATAAFYPMYDVYDVKIVYIDML